MPLRDDNPLLRRKLIRGTPPVVPAAPDIGPAAGLLRAFSRVLSSSSSLVAEDAALHRKTASLAELLDTIEPDAFVISLVNGAQLGIALLDQTGFSTLIEAMTMGRLAARTPQPRRATATDATLLGALIDSTLRDLGADATALYRTARAVPDHRLLGVLLEDAPYDLVALTLQLVCGPVTRPARLMLALPQGAQIHVDAADVAPRARSWSDTLEASVLASPALLHAELGRVTLPLSEVLALGVGGRLHLPLSNLEEVRLVALDGSEQGRGRLGQSRGMRAVRLTVLPGAPTAEAVMLDATPRKDGGAMAAS